MTEFHLELDNEVYQEPLFDDVADDINFSGNIIRSAKTETDGSVETM